MIHVSRFELTTGSFFVVTRPLQEDRRVSFSLKTVSSWQQLDQSRRAHAVILCSLAMMGKILAQLLICFWITLPLCVTEKAKERSARLRDAEFTDKVGLRYVLKKC